jgi:putative spermidine/putrescine transport system ATP-binding protein
LRHRAAEIGAHGVTKRYGAFEALHEVTLTIARGEFLTLLGPSGSGKTTFLMVLSGFESISSGRITMDGHDVTTVMPERRGFGVVFQGYALFPHMTVEENIAFPLKVQRRSPAEISRRVKDMIEMVGLLGHANKRPAALSGGQQQRVALARALAYSPPVLLLDEPLSALDKNLRGQMQDEIRRLHRETGTTCVFVTHDQAEALALSSRVAIFDHGRLQQIAGPREAYERPANRFVAEFLGEINVLALTEVISCPGGGCGRFEGRVLYLLGPDLKPSSCLAIRPEHMWLLAEAPPQEDNAVVATIEESTYLGANTRILLHSRGGTPMTLIVDTARLQRGVERGAEVWITWSKEHGVFI